MRTTIALAVLATSLVSGAAWATPPANIAGTAWTVQANQSTEQLVITSQGGGGGPAGPTCLPIVGTIGIAPIRGWYCPSTGRIHFLHNNLNSDVAVRVFTGNVSDVAVGQPLRMGGTVTIVNVAFGPFGEHNFSAM